MYLYIMINNEYRYIYTAFLYIQRFWFITFINPVIFLYIVFYIYYMFFIFPYMYIFIFPVVLNLQRFFLLWYNSPLFIIYSVIFIFANGSNWLFSIFSCMFLFFSIYSIGFSFPVDLLLYMFFDPVIFLKSS